MTACDHKVAAVKRMAKAGRSSRQQAWATPLRIESSGRNLRTPSDTRTIDAAQIINESAADRRKMSVIASIATLRRIAPPTKAPACENPRPAGVPIHLPPSGWERDGDMGQAFTGPCQQIGDVLPRFDGAAATGLEHAQSGGVGRPAPLRAGGRGGPPGGGGVPPG